MSGNIGGGTADASIPLQAGRGTTQPENPLQMVGQFANVQNALNANRLFPGQLQQQQQATQSGAVTLAQHINQAAYGAMAPLLSLPPGSITHDVLTSNLASTEHNLGIPTSGVLSDLTATAPSGDGPEFDARVRALIASRAQIAPESAVGMVTPHAGPTIDTGPTIQPTTVAPPGSPTAGQITPAGGSYGKGLTPGEATTPVQVGITPQGAPIMAPLGGSPFANGGRMNVPPALRNPNAPPTVGGVVTGLGPAQTAAAGQTGAQSATAFQHIADQGVQAKSQGAVLDTMLGDTAQFATGPGAQGLKAIGSVLQRYAPLAARAFGVTPESLAANESFDKFANQLADAQGAGSDARLAVNQGANPSAHLTPAGVDLIIRQLRGNSDYLAARAQLAAQYPDKTDRSGFEANIGANLDPRVFQIARMTPSQKATFYNSMQDKAAFQRSYRWAEQNNVIPNASQ
jgi:hypothetical protein